MKNILVIGGSYFAGRVFVEALSALDNVKVHVFNRGNLPVLVQGVTQLVGDRDIPETLSLNIPNRHWDVVVDFCAYTPEQVTSLLQRIPGTVGHYLLISTTSVYAPSPNVPIPEEATKLIGPQPELGEFSDYGYLKCLAEIVCAQICRGKNIPYTILRPAIIYGKYNYAPRESYLFDRVIANEPFVIPEKKGFFYSFVWVEDLAEILIACLENEKTFGETFNVAAEERISYSTLADMIEEVSGKSVRRRVMSLDEIIRERAPMPFPPNDHLLYDGSKLQHVLGFIFTPFVIGLAKTWHYYQAVIQRRIEMQNRS